MYEEHFGLSDKPFKLSPDPKYFFSSAHHDRAVAYLQYGLSQGEGFIVVTGPIGTGKTTIARSLLASLDSSIVAAQIATTRLNPDELVRLVGAQFNIDVEGLSKADILKRLEDFLHQLNRQGKRALLVVDEAQNLPAETVEELRMLSNFQMNDRPLIQSFLLGQEELKPIIELPEMEQFRQRIIASCHLRPFSSEEVHGYIEHRLTQAGWSGRPSLETGIFDKITEYTGGVPRKINIFADRLFLYAFLEDLSEITMKDIDAVIGEMGEELSGSLQSGRAAAASVIAQTENSELTDSDEVSANALSGLSEDDIKRILGDVTHVMDQVIQRKIKIIRYLDKLIASKKSESKKD
ncbi:XrtA/PEP-CTERM system-associated ATPase [Echinimonas agarilytica]|uniref:XrtA-associated ATPase n=1 Tax=Echinimonas agarilytica TaxID=1215918 RepID=A0AA41W9Z4_9GAMM|nr:XrtA/PEP-CTERM system-associated ATPase [Echinimonas agarilytica]MCM2681465.1 XrtA-associated ATPase [Echinimonas agarilytica]